MSRLRAATALHRVVASKSAEVVALDVGVDAGGAGVVLARLLAADLVQRPRLKMTTPESRRRPEVHTTDCDVP